ncbi:MAG TPA: histidine kinase [Ruminiclostridium sp.]|nr:histidine kinase [Ruminiclostridium sp.]
MKYYDDLGALLSSGFSKTGTAKRMVKKMNDSHIKLYSALLRVILISIIIGYPIFNAQSGFDVKILNNAYIVFIVLAMFSANIILWVSKRLKVPCLIISISASCVLYFVYNKIFILIFVICLFDILALFNLNALFGLLFLLLYPYSGQYRFAFMIFTLIMTFLYYLLFSIVDSQSVLIEESIKKKQQLLRRLSVADKARKLELNRTILRLENQRLQEKSELSQNLHDKIGHAINGSIFKLEGAKLLINRDTAKSEAMIADVISALRESVDEIRALLRNEKPSAELLNINKLKTLFVDFTDKYEIETNFAAQGDLQKIPFECFGALIDNTIEALSNSLKYARCTKINAVLMVYNKILRYTISDNGVGAEKIMDSMGLSGIKERIQALGGKVYINGENGFEINMLIPVDDTL